MNEHVVREATADDAAQILELRERSILALCVGDYADEQIAAWMGKRLATEYQQYIEKSPFFVSTLGSKVTGYAAYNPNSQQLSAVYVDPDFVRQGAATSLVKAVISDARERGVESLWLDASLTAVPFYEAAGFTPVKETKYAFGGVSLECLRMKTGL
jgi:N-acetylglutamate synthase-like GNAT family acetyltransferase